MKNNKQICWKFAKKIYYYWFCFFPSIKKTLSLLNLLLIRFNKVQGHFFKKLFKKFCLKNPAKYLATLFDTYKIYRLTFKIKNSFLQLNKNIFSQTLKNNNSMVKIRCSINKWKSKYIKTYVFFSSIKKENTFLFFTLTTRKNCTCPFAKKKKENFPDVKWHIKHSHSYTYICILTRNKWTFFTCVLQDSNVHFS